MVMCTGKCIVYSGRHTVWEKAMQRAAVSNPEADTFLAATLVTNSSTVPQRNHDTLHLSVRAADCDKLHFAKGQKNSHNIP